MVCSLPKRQKIARSFQKLVAIAQMQLCKSSQEHEIIAFETKERSEEHKAHLREQTLSSCVHEQKLFPARHTHTHTKNTREKQNNTL